MSFLNDEVKLTAVFRDAWKDVDNEFKDIPVDLVGEKTVPNTNGEIVRFRVKRAMSAPHAIGTSRRNFGSVIVQFVTPSGNGPGRALAVADFIASIFAPGNAPITIGGIKCKTPSANGPLEDGALVTINVDVPFSSSYSA